MTATALTRYDWCLTTTTTTKPRPDMRLSYTAPEMEERAQMVQTTVSTRSIPTAGTVVSLRNRPSRAFTLCMAIAPHYCLGNQLRISQSAACSAPPPPAFISISVPFSIAMHNRRKTEFDQRRLLCLNRSRFETCSRTCIQVPS